MSALRVFVDFVPTGETLDLLKRGTEGHQLLFPEKPVASVLAKAERDPQFNSANVAFGQPDPQAIMEASDLKWIHISSSGITRYDNPGFRSMAARRSLLVTNSASVYNEACAVHVLGFMLAQARKLPLALKTSTSGGTKTWDALRSACGTLRGETVLILGYGAIGTRLTELLLPLAVQVVAYRRKRRGDEQVPVIHPDELAPALSKADHVVNILPDSSETRGFFDSARFSCMKPGATFYNIGRGATVDQGALFEALQTGRVGAAWLDVTEPEPLPANHPLLTHPNCFITPHIAGGHAGETKTLVQHFVNNLDKFTRGEALADRVM